MHDIFSREPDPLEGLLHPPSMPPESEALRQAVYARTRRVLRRRRLLGQFAYAAALLVSFVAGLLVMRLTTRPASTDIGERGGRVADSLRESDRTRGASAPHSDESALAREW